MSKQEQKDRIIVDKQEQQRLIAERIEAMSIDAGDIEVLGAIADFKQWFQEQDVDSAPMELEKVVELARKIAGTIEGVCGKGSLDVIFKGMPVTVDGLSAATKAIYIHLEANPSELEERIRDLTETVPED